MPTSHRDRNSRSPHSVEKDGLVRIADLETLQSPPRKRLCFVHGVTPASEGGNITGAPRGMFRLYDDVLVSNEVFIFGYPRSLGIANSPIDLTRPLLRRGIIAAKNDADQTIILDCPVYQGNSGGLVIEVELDTDATTRHFHPIGIVASFIPFVERFRSLQFGTINTNVENSGYSVVIPMDRIAELLPHSS